MFILKEKIKTWGWIGIVISFFGVSLVARGEGEGIRFEPAAFLILLAAISTSFYFVLQKPYLKKYSPLKFVTYTIWSGTFFQIFSSFFSCELSLFIPGISHINCLDMVRRNSFLSIISGRGFCSGWGNNCEYLGEMRAFLFLHAIPDTQYE
jgi:drug/metabolite transporter (DMT)-like permease